MKRVRDSGAPISGSMSTKWSSSARMRARLTESSSKGAAGAGFQIALEVDSALLVRKFDGDVKLPGAIARGVGAAAGVVVGEAGGDVGVRTM